MGNPVLQVIHELISVAESHGLGGARAAELHDILNGAEEIASAVTEPQAPAQ